MENDFCFDCGSPNVFIIDEENENVLCAKCANTRFNERGYITKGNVKKIIKKRRIAEN